MGQDPNDRRPSPEALLAAATREQRSRLKVFVGAAPGVGKTYAMLQAARERQRDGVDVVVGVVETHGRSETEALLDGLEVVPRQAIAYHGQTLSEMDLDAILERRPELVLVDELAHTNAPGCRHPARPRSGRGGPPARAAGDRALCVRARDRGGGRRRGSPAGGGGAHWP